MVHAHRHDFTQRAFSFLSLSLKGGRYGRFRRVVPYCARGGARRYAAYLRGNERLFFCSERNPRDIVLVFRQGTILQRRQ